MGMAINLDYENVKDIISENDLRDIKNKTELANKALIEKTGQGKDYLGWLDLPYQSEEDIPKFNDTVEEIRLEADVLISIGIGGSYLGARAVIEALQPNFINCGATRPQIYYAGFNIDSGYLTDLLELVKNKKCWVNVISKSGTTTEPGIAFRVIKSMMEKTYGKDIARKRIIATTDQSRGALKQMANQEGYTTFEIPDNVGGRFSVLSPVGLLPISVAGIHAKLLLNGARDMAENLNNFSIFDNLANLYAGIRYLLYQKGKSIELLANFSNKLAYFSEWWKQLFGESEGKNSQGIFPSSANFTADLHSLGQYIQEGRRDLFETFLIINHIDNYVMVPDDKNNLDGLNYLTGKTFQEINLQAYKGTAEAHRSGGVPNMTIHLPELNAYWLGQLIFFFEKAVAVSGYMFGINPFDQPGVEAYKQNMFRLLGKPGIN
jgi:glucose-6-phosphate isomerase